MDKKEAMREVRDAVMALGGFLADERRKNNVYPVLGEGSHDAAILFIGEAPGRNEAATGRPFCGQSGKILSELVESIGSSREDVYITNIVKDRPPENRDPSPDEIALYAPFLDQQIDIIQPKVIATLGRFSMAYIFHRFGLDADLTTISKMHGNTYKAQASWGSIQLVPLYHPAVAIYNRHERDTLFDDFQVLSGCLL